MVFGKVDKSILSYSTIFSRAIACHISISKDSAYFSARDINESLITAVEEESTKAVRCFWLRTLINHSTSVDRVKREKASFSIPLATHVWCQWSCIFEAPANNGSYN